MPARARAAAPTRYAVEPRSLGNASVATGAARVAGPPRRFLPDTMRTPGGSPNPTRGGTKFDRTTRSGAAANPRASGRARAFGGGGRRRRPRAPTARAARAKTRRRRRPRRPHISSPRARARPRFSLLPIARPRARARARLSPSFPLTRLSRDPSPPRARSTHPPFPLSAAPRAPARLCQVMATIHTPGYSNGLSKQEMFDMKVKAEYGSRLVADALGGASSFSTAPC